MRARVPPPGVFIKPSQISNPSALKASHLEFAFECSQNKCFRNHGGSEERPWEPESGDHGAARRQVNAKGSWREVHAAQEVLEAGIKAMPKVTGLFLPGENEREFT